ncbi:MAG: hypothetical protein GTN78_26305, partial [Gemmatimonadales bacterium]|nr:hypothetical protein [Gemmatimonadales bacterium]
MGIGLGGIAYWTTQWPFADAMKRGCRWRYDSDESTCSNVDSSGWPQEAGVHSYIFLDAWDTSGTYRYPTGDWVLTWEGGDV